MWHDEVGPNRSSEPTAQIVPEAIGADFS